jgi:hypothetical protein
VDPAPVVVDHVRAVALLREVVARCSLPSV